MDLAEQFGMAEPVSLAATNYAKDADTWPKQN